MPASLGSAVLYLETDDKKLKAGVSQAEKSTAASLNKIGKGMQSTGAMMTAGLTAPIIAAGAVSIGAASNLRESMNAVNVVFQDASGTIENFGKVSATQAGLSTREFNELATVTGAFLTNLGYNSDEAASKTIDLTKRAADMGSVFNKDVSVALEAINSGLKGEFNPLEQFGVKMNAAGIEARALSMGLADSEGNLSDNAKAQAALAIIMEQTNKLQGDFTNTSNELANSTRITKAELENEAAALGQQLLPVALQVVGAVRQAVTWFGSLSPQVKTGIIAFLGLVAVLGPIIAIIGTLITAISAIIPVVTAVAGVLTFPLIAIIAAVIAIIALLAAAWANDWGGIREKTQAAITWISTIIQTFLAAIQAWWQAHGDQVKAVVTAFWNAIQAVVQRVTDIMSSIVKAFQKAREGDWYAFGSNLRDAWDKAWQLIKDILSKAWEFIKTTVTKLINNVIDAFKKTDWGAVGNSIVRGIADGISSAAHWVVEAAKKAVTAAYNAAMGFLQAKSPSKLMMKVGGYFDTGLAKGIDVNTGKVVKSALRMSGKAVAGATKNITNNYSLTGQYAYQSESTLMDQVRLLQLMEATR